MIIPQRRENNHEDRFFQYIEYMRVQLSFNINSKISMNYSHITNKQTTNTFYLTNYTDILPFSFKNKLANSNLDTLQRLNIEAQSRMEKLKQKINLDEAKIQRNYSELQELSVQIQQACQKIYQDKEIQVITKNRKESIKEAFANCKNKSNALYTKCVRQTANIRQMAELKQLDLEREKQQRESDILKVIDEFEGEIVQVQKQLKQIRQAEEEVFQKLEIDLYNLEDSCNNKLENEVYSRKKEHQTIIKLIGECIQNFRYIY